MTSTIMREPEVYDVWLMRVEFPDHPGVGKVRPVIVTRVEEVSGLGHRRQGDQRDDMERYG